jgi:hypothetical protein
MYVHLSYVGIDNTKIQCYLCDQHKYSIEVSVIVH